MNSAANLAHDFDAPLQQDFLKKDKAAMQKTDIGGCNSWNRIHTATFHRKQQ